MAPDVVDGELFGVDTKKPAAWGCGDASSEMDDAFGLVQVSDKHFFRPPAAAICCFRRTLASAFCLAVSTESIGVAAAAAAGCCWPSLCCSCCCCCSSCSWLWPLLPSSEIECRGRCRCCSMDLETGRKVEHVELRMLAARSAQTGEPEWN